MQKKSDKNDFLLNPVKCLTGSEYLSSPKVRYEQRKILEHEYYYLAKKVGWNGYPLHQVKHALKNSLYSIVALVEDFPVGIARLSGDGIYYIISDVMVDPAFQNQGIGSQMIQLLIEELELSLNRGSVSIMLKCSPETELFYLKNGFSKSTHSLMVTEIIKP